MPSELPTVGLDGLCAIWTSRTIRVLLRDSAHLAKRPETLQRIRGVIGRVLYASASQSARDDRPCSFVPPCGYDLFHRSQGKLANGRDIPMPFVVECDPVGKDLLVSFRLFGRATDWLHEFRAALVTGLRTSFSDNRRRKHPQKIAVVEVDGKNGIRIYPLIAPVVVELVTPVMQSRDGSPVFDFVSLMTGLSARVAGMAWWHDRRLVLESDQVKIAALELIAGVQSDLTVMSHPRSYRNLSRARTQIGTKGWLRCPPPLQPLSTLLQLGVETHLGAKTSAGAGRYRLKME
jgi:hypothetical protein